MPYESVTETLYTIAATATGGRTGTVRSEDGIVDLPLGKPGGSTPKANPETLFASGYAACFSGALNGVGRTRGQDTSDSTVTVDVTFGKTDSGVGLAAAITAKIPGVDAQTAQEMADEAHVICPYSKATRGNIDVTVTGEPA